MNEEDIRTKILVPWLEAVGISGDEFDTEFGFSIRVGREKVKLPRSDLVVRKHGRPLVVVEAKEPQHKITAVDCEQAVSYARLLQPNMAPFAVVTNGQHSEVLNVATCEPVTWSISDTKAQPTLWEAPAPDPNVGDINLRFQALRRLISLSPENARRFCKAQIEDVTARNRIEGPRPEFDPELHVARDSLTRAFARFLESDDRFFFITAPSGIGKTSECIRMANDALVSDFPMYVPLDLADAEPLNFLAGELSWRLSSTRTEQHLLRDLDELCQMTDRRLLLILDEADSCDLGKLLRSMERLHSWIRDLEGRTRVVLALQPATLDNLRNGLGYPTFFTQIHAQTYQLTPLSSTEADRLIILLRKRFRFEGDIVGALRQRCMDPTFAHLLARQFANARLPQDALPGEVFSKFVRNLCRRTGDEGGVDAVLAACAQLMLQENTASLALDRVADLLRAEPHAAIRRAERIGLLSIVADLHGRLSVSFGDSWIRNYLVAVLSLRLDLAASDSRPQLLITHAPSRIAREAINWFLWAFPNERHSYLVDVESTACRYLEAYEGTLALFPVWQEELGALSMALVPSTDWSNPWYAIVPKGATNAAVEWSIASHSEVPWDAIDRLGPHSIDEQLYHGALALANREHVESAAREDVWKYVAERLSHAPLPVHWSSDLATDVVWALVDTFPEWIDDALVGAESVSMAILQQHERTIYAYLGGYEQWRRAHLRDTTLDDSGLWEAAAARATSGNVEDTRFRFRGDSFPYDTFALALRGLAERETIFRVCRPALVDDLERWHKHGLEPRLLDELRDVLERTFAILRTVLGQGFQPLQPHLPRFGRRGIRLRVEVGRRDGHAGPRLHLYWLESSDAADTVEIVDLAEDKGLTHGVRHGPFWWDELQSRGVFLYSRSGVRKLLGLSRPPSFGEHLRQSKAEQRSLLWAATTTWLREDVLKARKAILEDV